MHESVVTEGAGIHWVMDLEHFNEDILILYFFPLENKDFKIK